MKTKITWAERSRSIWALGLLILFSVCCNGQTEEEKKQQEEKMAKMLDSMMNDAGLGGFMDQLKERGDEQKEQMEKQKAAEKKQQEKERAIAAKKSNHDFYWRNATASDTNGKMIDWKFGAADIKLSGTVVGNISGTGQVTINLPESIPTGGSIERGLIPEMHTIVYDQIKHSHPNTPFRSHFSLPVMKGDDHIGSIYMGNVLEVAYNMAAPCCLHLGHEGYRLYWAYVENACTASVVEKRTKTTDAGEIMKTTEEYDLNFKPGWNFIKTEIIGNYGTAQFKTKKHTVVSTMSNDTKYFFLKN